MHCNAHMRGNASRCAPMRNRLEWWRRRESNPRIDPAEGQGVRVVT